MITADDVETLLFDVSAPWWTRPGRCAPSWRPRWTRRTQGGQALAGVLRDGPRLPEAAVRHLALAGHRLRAWPDTQAALRRLAGRFTIVALPDGNLPVLTDLFAAAGLTWHCGCPARWCTPASRTPRCTGSRWTGWRSTRAGHS